MLWIHPGTCQQRQRGVKVSPVNLTTGEGLGCRRHLRIHFQCGAESRFGVHGVIIFGGQAEEELDPSVTRSGFRQRLCESQKRVPRRRIVRERGEHVTVGEVRPERSGIEILTITVGDEGVAEDLEAFPTTRRQTLGGLPALLSLIALGPG